MNAKHIATLDSDDYDAGTLRLTCANQMLSTLVNLLATHDTKGPFQINAHRLAESLHGVSLLLDEAEQKFSTSTGMQEVAA